jgi:short-subunit dehydrogenase
MAGYCATKAFVLSLSQAVNHELKGFNVTVSALCPGVTDSLFHEVAQSKKTAMSKLMAHATPKEVAEYGYKLIMKRKPLGIYGIGRTKLWFFSTRLTPRKMLTALSGKNAEKPSNCLNFKLKLFLR